MPDPGDTSGNKTNIPALLECIFWREETDQKKEQTRELWLWSRGMEEMKGGRWAREGLFEEVTSQRRN